MSDTPSDQPLTRPALRIALAFAAALTLAEAADLELTFIAPLIAGTLAAAPGPPAILALVLPLVAWLLVGAVAILVELFAVDAPLVFGLVAVCGLWAGFLLSARHGGLSVLGLLMLIFFTIAPMRLFAYPEVADVAVNDIGRNVLVGAATAWVVGLLLPLPPRAVNARPPFVPLPPLVAALVTGLGAYLVWVLEPPAPGALLIGVIITLRADQSPERTVVRDRFLAALVGGAAAVLAATLIALAPVLPMLFLATLLIAWPIALRIVEDGPWRGAAAKTLNALAILTAEGFSPLFEDTEERLWIRIAGVFIGLLYASGALVLLGRRPAAAAEPAGPLDSGSKDVSAAR